MPSRVPARSSVARVLADRRAGLGNSSRVSASAITRGTVGSGSAKRARQDSGAAEGHSALNIAVLHILIQCRCASSWAEPMGIALQNRLASVSDPDLAARQWRRIFRQVSNSARREGQNNSLANQLHAMFRDGAEVNEGIERLEVSKRALEIILTAHASTQRVASMEACSPPRTGQGVKTLLERFAHTTNSLCCPHGCPGSVRYGHRVGDVGKYAAMERDVQSAAVLCYCPACHDQFDAWL